MPDEEDKEANEKKANRFAAEFLIDEMMLRQETDIYKIKKISIKSILQPANLFTVPYRAMTKRLNEIGLIGEDELKRFLSESDDSIQQYKKRYAFSPPETFLQKS